MKNFVAIGDSQLVVTIVSNILIIILIVLRDLSLGIF